MGYKHHDEHKKATLRAIYRFAQLQKQRRGHQIYHTDIFEIAGVSKTQGYRILKDADRPSDNESVTEETRGRKKIVSDEDRDKIEDVVWSDGIQGLKPATYKALLQRAGVELDCSKRTISRALGQRDWRRCSTCQQGFVSKDIEKARVEQARRLLEKRPNPEDWRDVRFSGEFHAFVGASGKIWVPRKTGERFCPNCAAFRPEREQEKYTAHFWAAVGYEFKTDLHEYKIDGDSDGIMTQQYYKEGILEPIVKPWLDSGRPFMLEEEATPGHGPTGDNVVSRWKARYRLKSYYNCNGSPDWLPIENVWRSLESVIKVREALSHQDLVTACQDGWGDVDQWAINSWIDSIPQRLQDTIYLEGKMTAW